MADYKDLLNPLLQKVEGSSPDSYNDQNDNPTVGNGINLNDPENVGILKMHGIDADDVKSGNRSLSPDEANDMDVFITLRKLDVNGNEVYFDSWHAPSRYPVALGSLRLSERELDTEKSTP